MKLICLDGATLYPVDDARWGRLSEFADVEIYDNTPAGMVVERARDAELLLTNKVPVGAAEIAALPSLRYIGVLATGYNIVDTEAARAAGITVCNIPAYSTASVAQHVFSLLLGIIGRVERYAAEVSQGSWSRCKDFTYRNGEWHELAGKTMGIVGYGNIGSAVARIAEAMGMNVAVATSKPQSALPQGFVKLSVDDLFATADVVSLHCPLTPDTRGMADARRLAMMKPSAILINTARGPLVDEASLADALNEGRIAAAGLDVLSTEPADAACPLPGARNCFITPHVAWASVEARQRLLDITVENIRAFLAGAPVNVVN